MEIIVCLIVFAIMGVVHFREEIFIKAGISGREPTFTYLMGIVASWVLLAIISVPFALYCICQENPKKSFDDIVGKLL